MLAVACANGICLWTLSRGLARHAWVAAGLLWFGHVMLVFALLCPAYGRVRSLDI